MKSSLFEYSDYKKYIKDRIESSPRKRGIKMRIAEHIQCHSSYVSQVLKGDSEFTLEQASRLNQFFHHNPLEGRYFVFLVEYARAGTEDLKEIFKVQIKEMQKSRFDLKRRLNNTEEIPEADRYKYYSAWYYSAIYVALSIPGAQDPQGLAERFHLPLPLVIEAIQFLEEIGLIEDHLGTYRVTKKHLHLDKNSEFIRHHHINWRSQALQAVERNLPEDFHYSIVVAIAEDDYQKMRDILVRSVENVHKMMGPSQEEKIYALTVDFFSL